MTEERVTEIGRPESIDTERHPWAAVVGLVMLLGLIVLGVIGFGGLIAESEDTTEVAQVVVPRLAGRTLEDAQVQLERLGLLVDVRYEPNERVPIDVVVEQEPIAGSRVEAGQQVIVTVSDGPAGLRVPDLAGLNAAEAQRLLSALGLRSQVTLASDEVVPQNEISGSSPAEGSRVMPGDMVEVLVSTGPRPRVVPDVVGQDVVTAMATVGLDELTIAGVTYVVDESVAPGTVLSTSPAAGTEVPRRQPISVRVAKAPQLRTIPDVVGLTRSSAEQVADSRDLTLRVTTEALAPGDPRDGRVISQEPVPNTPVAGQEIVVVVGSARAGLVTTTTTTPGG